MLYLPTLVLDLAYLQAKTTSLLEQIINCLLKLWVDNFVSHERVVEATCRAKSSNRFKSCYKKSARTRKVVDLSELGTHTSSFCIYMITAKRQSAATITIYVSGADYYHNQRGKCHPKLQKESLTLPDNLGKKLTNIVPDSKEEGIFHGGLLLISVTNPK